MDTRRSPHARVRALPVGDVELLDGLWRDRVEANRMRGIPRLLDRLEAHGVVDNFRVVAGALDSSRRGFWFTDSDLYKWMEAAAWSLATHPDPELETRLAALVDTVLAAQRADGYLGTAFAPDEQLRQLGWSHELYCAGHLIQAAIARSRASGDARLLDGATRFADLLCEELGPGRREETDRHPGVEAALVELSRATGEARYLELGRALCERVAVDGPPVGITGHAVRAVYFATGLADVALETGDTDTVATLVHLWSSMVDGKSYVTGAVGGRWIGESFGRDYELPNEGSYAETCGGVAVAHWAWRMLLLTGDACFADRLELALHNAVLAGVSLGGDEWFYANPLAATGEPDPDPWATDRFAMDMAGPLPLTRRPWRDVTCCPPNVSRMLASLPGYLYGESDDGLWVHLYAASRVRSGRVALTQRTAMPWAGTVEITVDDVRGDAMQTLHLRVPGWSRAARVRINGESWPDTLVPATYAAITRPWSAGDSVVLDLDLAPVPVECNPRVAENRGSIAVARGPLVFCAEEADQPAGVDPLEAGVLAGGVPAARVEHHYQLLGGISVVHVPGQVPEGSFGSLYRPLARARHERPVTLALIPYFAWGNRGLSRMAVWMRRA